MRKYLQLIWLPCLFICFSQKSMASQAAEPVSTSGKNVKSILFLHKMSNLEIVFIALDEVLRQRYLEHISHFSNDSDKVNPYVLDFNIGKLRFQYLFDEYVISNKNTTFISNSGIKVFSNDSLTNNAIDPIEFYFKSTYQESGEHINEEIFLVKSLNEIVFQRINDTEIIDNEKRQNEILQFLIKNLGDAGFKFDWNGDELQRVKYKDFSFSITK